MISKTRTKQNGCKMCSSTSGQNMGHFATTQPKEMYTALDKLDKFPHGRQQKLHKFTRSAVLIDLKYLIKIWPCQLIKVAYQKIRNMPKNKKLESDSDSDSSGPEDRTPAKKPKAEEKSSSSSSKSKGKGGGGGEDDTWQLDKKRVVKINEFRGRVFVDIREYYEDKDGELKPGKKGISLSMEQYKKFKEIQPEIDEALKNK